MIDPPSQSHSPTSIASARALSKLRVLRQERWVYQALRQSRFGLADWEMWDQVQLMSVFDKLSSLHRARIGLLWRSRVLGATPWHPVEDSGRRKIDPQSNRRTVVWRIKLRYQNMTYDEWASVYRDLARGLVL